MPALDYPWQTDTDVPPVEQAPPISQFDLPPSEVPQVPGKALDFADLPPAMGAVGSRPGRGNSPIQNIILHSSDGRESGDLNTLTKSANAGAHFYVTRDGRIFPLVNLDDTAFHAGKVNNPAYSNESTIGIEQEHYDPGGPGGKEGEDWPDVQVQATARLVSALQDRYGLTNDNVKYHSEIAYPAGRKQDPFNYPRDRFNSFVAQAKSGGGTQVAQAQGPTIPPIVYPWEAMNPQSVTIGDVIQQQQQRETGNIVMVNQPQQALQVRATHYAYPGEESPDPNSAKGIGAGNRPLGSNSVAFSPDVEQALQAKLGDQFVTTGADGTQRTVTFDDRTNPNLQGRVDFYDKSGNIGDQGTVNIARVGGQPQQFAIPPEQYPWENMTAAVNPDQVNQAVNASLARNAFASTEAGVPAGYVPSRQQQKVGLVISSQPSTEPKDFGMRVATADGVKAYDQYIANGGDPNAIDPYDRLGVILAKNPNALLDKNNRQLLDEMVVKPQAAASKTQSMGEKFWNAVGAGISGIGDAWNAGVALVKNEAKDIGPAMRYWYEKATGQTPDPEALSGVTDMNALNAQGAGKTVSDVYNFLTIIRQARDNLYVPIHSMFTNDPQKLQELNMQHLSDIQTLAADRQKVADLGNQWQTNTANAYASIGMFADLGQNLKNWKADPQAVEGFSQIAQLAAPGALEALGGMKVAGAFRPFFAGRVLEAGADAVEARSTKFLFDSTQSLPRNAAEEAANPNYLGARSAQAGLAPEARAADAASNQANSILQQQLTNVGRISTDPGTATQFLSTVQNLTGNALAGISQGSEKVLSLGDRVLNAAGLGNPVVRELLDKISRPIMFGIGGALHHSPWAARLFEAGVDALEHVDQIPKAASAFSDLFKTMGRETLYGETQIPYWQRVSQGNKLISPHMAAFLDSPAVQTIASAGKGVAGGMATGAFIGALSDPDDPLSGAIEQAIPGGLFGMVGGGFGQWLKYNTPGDVYLKARGDWKRTLDTFAGPQRDQFLSLAPKDQLMLSTYLQQVPSLKVDFIHDPAGFGGRFDPHVHTFGTDNNPKITINLANPESTVRGIFAHELMHATQSAGMTTDIYDALLGNVDRSTPGQYTAQDAKGNPLGVDPATGRYTTNQDFQNFKNSYVTSLARSGEPTAHLSDLDIARELFAEHGVDHLLSPQGAVDATSAFRPGWINRNMLKNAYAKLGFAFDRQGNMVTGTHLFDNVRPNDVIDKLTQRFFKTGFRERSIDSEELPTRTFTREDLRSTNAADTFLDTAPEIMRNPDGSVMRDARGVPLMRTPAQVRQYNAKLASDTFDRISALSDDQKMAIGHRILPNGNIFVRYLPQELRDGLAKTNEYNPHQIKALNALSEMLADKSQMGTNFRIFYHKALSEGKRYRSFSGTEKFAVPYGFEISNKDNISLRSVDFDQLNDNYLKNATRAPFRQLWGTPSEFVQDSNTYFQNHARGEPGATGIGEAKRDAINALLRLDTSVNRDANPLLEARGGKGFPGTRPIIKSYRIDRASQVTPLEKTSPFTTEEQYYKMNRNYRPAAPERGVSYLPRAAATAETDLRAQR